MASYSKRAIRGQLQDNMVCGGSASVGETLDVNNRSIFGKLRDCVD